MWRDTRMGNRRIHKRCPNKRSKNSAGYTGACVKRRTWFCLFGKLAEGKITRNAGNTYYFQKSIDVFMSESDLYQLTIGYTRKTYMNPLKWRSTSSFYFATAAG